MHLSDSLFALSLLLPAAAVAAASAWAYSVQSANCDDVVLVLGINNMMFTWRLVSYHASVSDVVLLPVACICRQYYIGQLADAR